jgi:hypothetical protein
MKPSGHFVNKEIMIASAKPGNGVDQIRDDNINTFWQ